MNIDKSCSALADLVNYGNQYLRFGCSRSKGVGKQLMEQLIEESEANEIWTLYSSTFQENKASICFRKNLRFESLEPVSALPNSMESVKQQ